MRIDDIHREELRRIPPDDWARLVRYWMVHGHGPALAAAIDCLRARAQPPHVFDVISHLEAVRADPLGRLPPLPESLAAHLTAEERGTLQIFEIFPWAEMCMRAEKSPIEQQPNWFSRALPSAARCANIANQIGDEALVAWLTFLVGDGCLHIGEWRRTVECCGHAAEMFHRLAEQAPLLYQPLEALAVERGAIAQCAMVGLDGAAAQIQQAAAFRRELRRQNADWPDLEGVEDISRISQKDGIDATLQQAEANFARALALRRGLLAARSSWAGMKEVALAEEKIGCMHLAFHRFAEAEAAFFRALQILRELESLVPNTVRGALSRTLAFLGSVQLPKNNLSAARSSLREALKTERANSTDPKSRVEFNVAVILCNLIGIEFNLSDFEAARQAGEEAAAFFRNSAQGWPQIFRPYLAKTLGNLATVYSALGQESTALNCFREAVDVTRELAADAPEKYEPELAALLVRFAVGLMDAKELPAAERALVESLARHDALEKRVPGRYRDDVACSLISLGRIQLARSDVTAAFISLKKAERIIREAVVRDARTFRPKLAFLAQSLGLVYIAKGRRENAIDAFKEAAALQAADAAHNYDAGLGGRMFVHTQLAMLALVDDPTLGRPDFRGAYRYFGLACRQAERFRGKFRDQAERRRVQTEHLRIFERHVQNCVDLWEMTCRCGRPNPAVLREGVWAAEAVRSRQLLDRLAGAELTPTRLTPKLAEALQAIDAEIARIVRRLELERASSLAPSLAPSTESPGAPLRFGNPEFERAAKAENAAHDEIARLEERKAELIQALRRADPDVTHDLAVAAQNFESIRRLLPDDIPTAFVQYTIGRDSSFALVILPSGRVFSVRLPELPRESLQALAREWSDGYQTARKLLGDEQAPGQPGDTWTRFRAFMSAWRRTQARVLPRLAQIAVAPIWEQLVHAGVRIDRMVIALHQELHNFPLHLCFLSNGKRLGDETEISYTPSFSLLHRCAERPRNGGGGLLLIEDPTRSVARSRLTYAEAESASIAAHYGRRMAVTALPGERATATAFVANAENARVLHYSGHSRFDDTDPLRSQLTLSGPPLTLADVFSKVLLRHAELVVLNGCESGLLRPDVLDDYHNFTTGFLFAGASCVVTTLWSVPDLPSALIMENFHARVLQGTPPAAALRAAQDRVRTLRAGRPLDEAVARMAATIDDPIKTENCLAEARRYAAHFGDLPFAHPVHWAAFTCHGLGFRSLV